MTAAELVRQTRLDVGLDQAALARRAGTTQTYVSRVERGAVSPSHRTLERLVHAMGRSLTLSAPPLEHGNASVADLRASLVELTPSQRLAEAMELSTFLTGLASRAAR